jgi:hypothetical protein
VNSTGYTCGYIGSPLFPKVYPVASTCIWDIAVRWTSFIKLEFLNLDVAGDGPACNGDQVVVVLFGLTGDDERTVTVCNGERTHISVDSDWNKISVRYQRVRTESEAGVGFIAKFTDVQNQQKLR